MEWSRLRIYSLLYAYPTISGSFVEETIFSLLNVLSTHISDAKNWFIGKDPDAGKDWRLEEKGMTEDKMVGWHHQLNGHEFESTLGVGDGQGGLVCCSPWGCKKLDTTEQLNWTEDWDGDRTTTVQPWDCGGGHMTTVEMLPMIIRKERVRMRDRATPCPTIWSSLVTPIGKDLTGRSQIAKHPGKCSLQSIESSAWVLGK